MGVARRTAIRSALALACLTAAGTGARRAAASPSAKLVFGRGAGTDQCPDEAVFRKAVATRVGYDPFFPYAKRTVLTRLDRAPRGQYRARMEILDDRGALLGEKTFVSTDGDCDELVRTLALAVGLAIDVAESPAEVAPESASVSSEPIRPAPEPPPPPSTLPNDTPPAKTEPERPAVVVSERERPFEIAGGGRGSFGLGPASNVGVALGAAWRARRWSVGIEGRYDFAGGTTVDSTDTSLTLSLLAGSFVPCLVRGILAVCATATVGRREAQTHDVTVPGSDGAFFLAVGSRVATDFVIGSAFAIRPAIDLAYVPIVNEVRVDGSYLYKTSIIMGSLSGSAVVRF